MVFMGFHRLCVCGIWVDPVPGDLTRVGVVGVVCLFCVELEGRLFGGGGDIRHR